MVQTAVPESVPVAVCWTTQRNEHELTVDARLFEDDAHSVIEIRTDSLQTLRELGPPDLVHLVKQPIKSSLKQVNPSRQEAQVKEHEKEQNDYAMAQNTMTYAERSSR